jgi:hypothetical protein
MYSYFYNSLSKIQPYNKNIMRKNQDFHDGIYYSKITSWKNNTNYMNNIFSKSFTKYFIILKNGNKIVVKIQIIRGDNGIIEDFFDNDFNVQKHMKNNKLFKLF